MTDHQRSANAGKGQLDREAAEWCVRMHGDDRERWDPDFEDWLRRGALHRLAYNRIEEVYLLGAKLKRDPDASEMRISMRRRKRRPYALAALAMAIVGAFWFASGVLPLKPARIAGVMLPNMRVSAPMGTEQQLRLADGSKVVLQGGSDLAIAIGSKERRIELSAGKARFYVAKDPRPFVVLAGGGRIIARGTVFDVQIGADRRVRVHLIEGLIDVLAPPRHDARPSVPTTPLFPGQEREFPIAEPQAIATAARVESHRQPETIGELVDLANARAAGTTRVEIDPALRATRLSGVFKVHDPKTVAERLAAMLGMKVDRSTPGVFRLSRSALQHGE